MTNATIDHQTIYAVRRVRLEGLMAGYECGPEDVSGCGTDYLADPATPPRAYGPGGKPGRWALIVERPRHGYLILIIEQRDDVDQVAARQIMDGRQPVCFYDLDNLAGPATETCDNCDGKGYRESPESAARCTECMGACEVERLDRMPERYGVAKIVTTVVFNSVPTEA